MAKKTTPDLKIKTRLTKKLKLRAEQVREGVRQDIIEKGYVHFRVKPELYRLLFEIADTKQVPLGVLCRQWVAERARQEELGQVNNYRIEKHGPTTRVNHNNLMEFDIVSLAKRLDKLESRLQHMR